MESKPCIDSLTVKTSHVLPPDTNSYGTLFGGKLMAHIDDVSAIAAARHARKQVVTASTDSVDFLYPVKEGDAICVESFVSWTHHTSMEVFSKVVTENLATGDRKVCTTAFLSFVAVDSEGYPTPVPSVYPESEQEKELNERASERADHRSERRKQSKKMAETFGTDFPWNRSE